GSAAERGGGDQRHTVAFIGLPEDALDGDGVTGLLYELVRFHDRPPRGWMDERWTSTSDRRVERALAGRSGRGQLPQDLLQPGTPAGVLGAATDGRAPPAGQVGLTGYQSRSYGTGGDARPPVQRRPHRRDLPG